MLRRRRRLAAAAAGLLVGIAPSVALSDDVPHDVPFEVSELNRRPLPDGVSQTLTFASGGSIEGNAGCNTFTAGYAAVGSAIIVQPARVTRMACPEPQMKAEQRFFTLLMSVTSLDYDAGEGVLLLESASGRPVIRLTRQEP